MERVYKTLPVIIDEEEALEILLNGKFEELMLLPLSLGEYFPDWKFAQNICLKLADNENHEIRANAILGLAYIARTKGILDEHLVRPIILRELRENIKNSGRIEDAIEDINIFLKWKINSAI